MCIGAIYMGKPINEPITLDQRQAHLDQSALPSRFTWRGRSYHIESTGGEWRILGRWWEGEGEQRYLRVITPTGLAMDLCQDLKTGNWMLHELQD